jgi:hypothetical protein
MSVDKNWMDRVIWALVGGTVGLVVVSLWLTLAFHENGTLEWDKLAQIGEFWSGHLNSVALIVLALTLLDQRNQFSEQQRTQTAAQKMLQEQLDTLRKETSQKELHFALEQLRAESDRLPFRRMTLSDSSDSDDWSPAPMQTGLSELEQAWREVKDSDDSTHVLFSYVEVRRYLDIAKMAETTIDGLGEPSLTICRPILGALAPEWLTELTQDFEGQRVKTIEFFAKNLPGTNNWKALIEQGWRLESCFPVQGGYSVTLYRESLHSPKRICCLGGPGATMATALGVALDRIEDYILSR